MNIYPPTVVNSQGIVKHTVSNEPGSIWEEIIPNSARRLETSTAGLATYQAAMGMINGSLQNVFGTTTTQSNAESAMSPQFGKTPEAIKYQQGRESSRDNQNRSYLQSAIEELMDAFMELIANMSTEPIEVTLFSEDIEEILKMGYEDIREMVIINESGTSAQVYIQPEMLKGVSYRFNMKPDSTIKMTKMEQKQSLLEFMNMLSQHQNELDAVYKNTGKMVDWESLFSTYAELADIPALENLFIQGEKPEENKPNPLFELLKAMNIRYEELPEDAKGQILEGLGIQTQTPSPRMQEIAIKQQEADIKDAKVRVEAIKPLAPKPGGIIDRTKNER